MVRTPVLFRILAIAAVLLPSAVSADIYDKRDLKPWFSLAGQANFQQTDGINDAVFGRMKDIFADPILDVYEGFDDMTPPYVAFDLGAGVEYERLLVGFHVGFTLPQVSQKPSGITTPTMIDSAQISYRDAKYYFVDLDFTVGWMLASPASVLNVIPSLRAGFSLLSIVYPANYPLSSSDKKLEDYRLRDRYYTSAGRSIGPELELRLKTSLRTRLSLYGGYRFTAFDQIEIETVDGTNYFPDNSPTDVDADNAYVGLKFTIVLQSDKEKARDFNKDD